MIEDYGDVLKISLKSQPTKGRANKELISTLSSLLGLHSSKILIIKGSTSTTKTIKILGISREELEEKLIIILQAQKKQ